MTGVLIRRWDSEATWRQGQRSGRRIYQPRTASRLGAGTGAGHGVPPGLGRSPPCLAWMSVLWPRTVRGNLSSCRLTGCGTLQRQPQDPHMGPSWRTRLSKGERGPCPPELTGSPAQEGQVVHTATDVSAQPRLPTDPPPTTRRLYGALGTDKRLQKSLISQEPNQENTLLTGGPLGPGNPVGPWGPLGPWGQKTASLKAAAPTTSSRVLL